MSGLMGRSRGLWVLGLSMALAGGPPAPHADSQGARLFSFLAPSCSPQLPSGALRTDALRSVTMRLRGGGKKAKERKSVAIPSRTTTTAPSGSHGEAGGSDEIEYEGVVPTDEISMGNDEDEWRNPDYYGSQVLPHIHRLTP